MWNVLLPRNLKLKKACNLNLITWHCWLCVSINKVMWPNLGFNINRVHFSAFIPPTSICILSPLLSALESSLCLILIILAKKSHVVWVSVLASSVNFTLSIDQACPSPLEAVLLSFLLLRLHMPKRVIRMRKADNAKQIMKVLKNVTNQTLSSQTICCHLRKSGLRSVVKKNNLFSNLPNDALGCTLPRAI